ncbi:hypothetical protein ATO13_23406 [Stappia sp. 22II-S9-Z10]|nr:hypothetical protein ATO13_23406 [Stappia sp. 22II-S9-Z10]
MKDDTCPKCGADAARFETRFGVRFDCQPCRLWAWHEGPLVDAETHLARRRAHAAFDVLWQVHGLTRSEAYRRLAAALGIQATVCHMKLMDKATAQQVPAAVESIRETLT